MNIPLLEPIEPIYLWLVSIMVPWGIIATYILAAIETVPFLGFLVPGEVTVVGAAFIVSGAGRSIWMVFLAAWLGSLLGVIAGYVVGRKVGFDGLRAFIRAWNERFEDTSLEKWVTVDAGYIEDTVGFFTQHGVLTTFAARFAVGAKSFIPPIAGAARMKFRKFFAASAAGTFLYMGFLVFVGWFLEFNAVLAGEIMKGFGWVAAVVLVLLVFFAMSVIRGYAVRRRRMFLEEQGFDVSDQTTIGERLVHRIDVAAGLADPDEDDGDDGDVARNGDPNDDRREDSDDDHDSDDHDD